MTNYIIRRLLIMPIIIFGVSILIFTMLQLLDPRERAALYVRDIPKNPNAVQEIITKYGLSDPIPLQYWHWLVGTYDPKTGETAGGILRGDFGWSRTAQRPVAEAILYYFPGTLELALLSIVPIILGGIWLGVSAAVHQNKFIDQFARVFAIVGYSFPTFVFGLLMLLIFYANLQWLPPGRLSDWANNLVNSSEFTRYTGMNIVDGLLNGRPDVALDAVQHMILPVLTLSYLSWALILRVTRSSMLEVLRQEYVTVARAKGLAESVVINKHALRNALIPVATIGGLTFAGLLHGVVITETVFNYRGIGWFAANSALRLDVVSVLGFTFISGIVFVSANLLVDILYGFLDPRVRLQ